MQKNDKDGPGQMQAPATEREGSRTRKLDKAVQSAIGARLRAYYDGVAREAVPDRFVQLLKQLEEKDRGGGKAD
jgi:hypothetical protein